jgi:hypothetical protein
VRTGASGDPANADDAYAAFLVGLEDPWAQCCGQQGTWGGPPNRCVLVEGHPGECEF